MESFDSEQPQVRRLTAEMALYEGRILDEMKRAAESLRTAYKIAADREAHLRESLATAVEQASIQEENLSTLRQLEQTVETYDTVYQDVLERFERTTTQQSIPIASVRILSRAEPPVAPSSPRPMLLMAIGLVLGSLAGAGLGVFRETNRKITTRDQVVEELDLDFVGYVPARGQPRGVARNAIGRTLSTLDELTAGLGTAGRTVVGIAAAEPEGHRSDVTRQLSAALAEQGETVLLIEPSDDQSAGSPGRSRLGASDGRDPRMTLHFQDDPGGYRVGYLSPPPDDPLHGKVSPARSLGEWVETVRPDYRYVLVRLPWLGASGTARAAAPHVDGFLLILPWDRVTPELAGSVLAENPWFKRKCIGVVLSDTNFRKLRLYVGRKLSALWRA